MHPTRSHPHKLSQNLSLTTGSISKGIIRFAVPMLLGQLLQQLYNMADAWVVGNFADNDAFAAVSSGGSLTFLVIGFFNGIAVGGEVVIARYSGAQDQENLQKAIHAHFLFGILSSLLATAAGVLLTPHLLALMNTPASVLPHSLIYFRIYFAGVSTAIMYNICMSIMRALGDSLHPLYYLILSSVANILLDLLFVAGFHWGVGGAASATVIAQGLSVVPCILRLRRQPDQSIRLDFKKLHFYKDVMSRIIRQGLPAGIQNSVISIGNLVIQTNINAFGSYAMSGQGAYSKIEGFVFLPITCMSMALPTFVSQNLGAGQYTRAKKGGIFGIVFGMILAELLGVLIYLAAPHILYFFVDSPEAVAFGKIHTQTVAPFFFLLAFSHCAAGVLRGCGKSFVPMVTMLTFWCGVRIVYVTFAVKAFPVFQTISWAYPLTWALSALVLFICLVRSDRAYALTGGSI